MASQPPPPIPTSNDDQVEYEESITKSDTPNGTHSVETVSQAVEESNTARKSPTDNEAQTSPPKEHTHNGVTSIEENLSSVKEANLSLMKETDVKEVKEPKLDKVETKTKAATMPPPPPPTGIPSSLHHPPPPSLVQSTGALDEPKSEDKTTIRTAPPALVGFETLHKQEGNEGTEDEEEMDLNNSEVHSLDPTQLVGEENRVEEDEGSDDVDKTAHQQQQHQQQEAPQQDMNEESPGLVIDMGSQPEPEDEVAPVIREPEAAEHRNGVVNMGMDSSQVSSESIKGGRLEEQRSPQSSSSNDEDVDLEMDIIEEGEEEGESPPLLPPPIPKGVLMKPPTSVTSAISQAHIQSLSSAHPRIGVSPSHTANRLAMESLKKGELVRKPNVIVSSPSSSGSSVLDLTRGGSNSTGKEGGGSDSGKDRQSVVTDNFRVRQVAKVKQFFTALQQFSNKRGSEVAEQVQELITAVVNETATVEEFHQEVQSVVNFPVKGFIIPFLKENLKHFRMELKESSHSLSELLGDDGPIPDTIGLTPQLVDDELPVLPSSSQGSGTVRTVGSSVITQSSHQANTASSAGLPTSTVSKSNSTTRSSHTSVTTFRATPQSSTTSSSRVHHQHGTGTGTNLHSHSHAAVVMDTDIGVDYVSTTTGAQRKRSRRASIENRSSGLEKEIQTDRVLAGHGPKRPRPDHTSVHTYGSETTVTTQASLSHPSHPSPHYPQPPPIHSLTPSPLGLGEGGAYLGGHPLEYGGGNTRRKALTEDWGHVQKMLSSIQGMVERATQAMALLKERVNATQTELEKRELERETLIKQRVSEAVDKVKRQSTEEKQRLIVEANAKLRETVSAARSEIEGRMAQNQSLAVQEALKEANTQSSSKENCWNCGRRATETCSGCNKARYCGTFCQHKDWANHMHHCASGLVGQSNTVEETYERRENIRHHQPIALAANEVALVPAGRGTPIRQTVAIPLNMVAGNEMSVHGIPARIPHSHTDIAVTVVKTEKV